MHPKHRHSGLRGQGDYAAPGMVAPRSSGSVTFGAGIGAPGMIPSERGAVADLRTNIGAVPDVPPKPPARARPRCAIEQCRQSIESAWFSWIDVAAPTIASGNSAWYGLRKINVAEWLSQEVRVLGLHYRMLPLDVAGQGWNPMSNPLPWGTAAGMGAAIVIGCNLGIDVGNWIDKPAWVAGLNITNIPTWQRNSGQHPTPAGLVAGSPQAPAYLFGPLRFPTGALSDVSPNIAEADISLQGDMAPVLYGDSLDVALVVDRQYVNGLTGQIAGFAQVDLVLGWTMNFKPWTN